MGTSSIRRRELPPWAGAQEDLLHEGGTALHPPGRVRSGETTLSAARLRSRTSKRILLRREETGRQSHVGSLRLSRAMLRARRPWKGLQEPGSHEQPQAAHVWTWQKDVLRHKRTPERGICSSSARLLSQLRNRDTPTTPNQLPGSHASSEGSFAVSGGGWVGEGQAPGLPAHWRGLSQVLGGSRMIDGREVHCGSCSRSPALGDLQAYPSGVCWEKGFRTRGT